MIDVFVDARSADSERLTGWERYASLLLGELSNDDDVTWTNWRPSRTGLTAPSRMKQDLLDVPRKSRSFDARFFPTYPPVGGSSSPTLWTLHDMTWLQFPQWASRLGRTYYRHLARRSLANSTHVITVSDAVRAELLDAGIAPQRVTRVYPGVSTHLLDLDVPPSDLPGGKPFVLCVGTAEPRKNLETLARAWIRSDLVDDFELVLVGRIGWGKLPSGLTHLNRPDDATLAGLYKGASAFVMPSFYEGFGLPLVEALQFGLPIACSDIAVFREVAGRHACFFDPADEAAMMRGIRAAINMGPFTPPRDTLAMYSWATAARELKELVLRIV